jgi:hypothetical protein
MCETNVNKVSGEKIHLHNARASSILAIKNEHTHTHTHLADLAHVNIIVCVPESIVDDTIDSLHTQCKQV